MLPADSKPLSHSLPKSLRKFQSLFRIYKGPLRLPSDLSALHVDPRREFTKEKDREARSPDHPGLEWWTFAALNDSVEHSDINTVRRYTWTLLREIVNEESCATVAHENMHFSDGNYETGDLKLGDENAKWWIIFERSYSYYTLQQLAAILPELSFCTLCFYFPTKMLHPWCTILLG